MREVRDDGKSGGQIYCCLRMKKSCTDIYTLTFILNAAKEPPELLLGPLLSFFGVGFG